MTQNRKAIIFIIVGIGLYLLALAAVSSASFARAGGTANVLSHSSDVQIEADNVGNVVSIAGNRNTLPQQPETEQHKRGEWLGLWAWVLLFAALVYLLFTKVMGFEIVLVREKSV